MRSAQALECKLIVPAKWVSWNGNTDLFEQLSINKALGVEKRVVFLFSALALWRKLSPTDPLTLISDLATESTLPLVAALSPYWLLPLLLQNPCWSHVVLWLPILISPFTDACELLPESRFLAENFMAGASEIFPPEKPSLHFPLFCCLRFGFCSLRLLSL